MDHTNHFKNELSVVTQLTQKAMVKPMATMAQHWRHAASSFAMTSRTVTIARRSFAILQHRSVQVEVADGVSLHALVPETTNGDAAAKTEFDVPVLCLPSSFGATVNSSVDSVDRPGAIVSNSVCLLFVFDYNADRLGGGELSLPVPGARR